jgi:hypothetical protein
MSAPNDGGPAFPTPNNGEWGFNSKNEKVFCPDVTPGMLLRDWFAGMALMGFSAHPHNKNWTPKEIANDAYLLADSMLVERTVEEVEP